MGAASPTTALITNSSRLILTANGLLSDGRERHSGFHMQIRKHFRFEAAHVLPHHPGKCSRMHGHSYRLDVAVRGPIQSDGPARGMIEDFDKIKRIVREHAVDILDHRTLNDLMENPTAEHIIMWIWRALENQLSGLDELVLWETATSCAVLRRSDFGA
jgi:6-pyruvoyltetrahydropterin/6-carboxytetrahydropterin synthase